MAWDSRLYKRDRRHRAITYLGGKCVDCETTDLRVLEFDHVTEKRSGGPTIAALLGCDWERLRQELDKCELVCANCHVIRTYNRD